MATLLKVLNNLADIKSAGGVALRVRTQASPLAVKVKRILAQVSDPNDRRWLAKKLENANEPSLGERIFETLSRINLGFEVKRLRAFSDKCAAARNDISHFGGTRHKGISYKNFIGYLNHASETLATLYEILLLSELGIEAGILKSWIFEGFRSHSIKFNLVKVGLLDESALDPKTPGVKTLAEGFDVGARP
jgi:hypothetical protein